MTADPESPGSALASRYDRARYNPAMRPIWPWPMVLLERVAARIATLPGPVWLDAACGEGHLGTLLARRKTLVGLDWDGARLTRAQSRGYHLLMRGSVTAIPVADGSLHGIACVETLEHVPDLDRALREFTRCLTRDGYLLLTLPSVTLRSWWQMRRTRQPVYCDEHEHVRELSSVPIRGFPHRFETWARFEARLASHGLTILETEGVGFLLPMWRGPLAWLERAMNLLYRESCNRWLGRLPGIRRFPYYRLYLLRSGGAP
ncbi:class I SAM-dependent methyltransferase [Nitrospira sp. Kam-Ns4a]